MDDNDLRFAFVFGIIAGFSWGALLTVIIMAAIYA